MGLGDVEPDPHPRDGCGAFRPAVVCGNRSPIHNSNHEARSLGEVGVEEIIVAAHPAPSHPGIFQANTLIILGFQYSGF
uniref:Uncharacterized protein n=1 Tax=Oryza sativa subsp. japonica TaxID=39947 RepID=Q67IW0_ORYSJ|nr:hypothetical protein [Oryza sativa Japonica Group]